MIRLRITRIVGAIGIGLGALGACNAQVTDGGSETNWLGPCETDADCTVGSCVCGRCSAICVEGTACPDGLDTCAGQGSETFASFCGMGATSPAGVCTMACGPGNACKPGLECRGGACVPVISGDPVTSETFFWRYATWSGGGPNALGGVCLPLSLDQDAAGNTPCSVVAALSPPCNCNEPGLAPASAERAEPARERLRGSGVCGWGGSTPACEEVCLCEVSEMTGNEGDDCRANRGLPPGSAGWCYAEPGGGIGSPTLVEKCKPTEQQMLRFSAPPTHIGTAFIVCVTGRASSEETEGANAPLGAACIPNDHTRPDFPGFSAAEVNVESGTAQCASGVCLAAYFQGRLGCPFGNEAGEGTGPACFTSGPDPVPVTVPVGPQWVSRPPEKTVYCSCRCAGSGSGPFCACPDGFECAPVVPDYGVGTDELSGSYCVKTGSVPSYPDLIVPSPCSLLSGMPLAHCEGR